MNRKCVIAIAFIFLIPSLLIGISFPVSAATEFPVVVNRTQGNNAAGTSHTITLPGPLSSSGDLFVLLVAMDGNTNNKVPNGWDELINSTFSDRMYVYLKESNGSETATFTITSLASVQSAFIAFRISNWAQITTGLTAGASSTTPDPPSYNIGGTAQSYLWFAFSMQSGGASCTVAPAEYTNLVSQGSTTPLTAACSAERKLESSSENPGPFTASGSAANWRTATLAISPETVTTNEASVVLWFLLAVFVILIALGFVAEGMFAGIFHFSAGIVGVVFAIQLYTDFANLILSLIVIGVSVMFIPYGLMRRQKVEI